MRRKTPISESRKPEVKSPVDVIGYYPVRGQAVIYLLLEYVNHALGAVMPYVGVAAYEEAFDRMVGLLVSGATDEALSFPLDRLSDELGTLWRMFEAHVRGDRRRVGEGHHASRRSSGERGTALGGMRLGCRARGDPVVAPSFAAQ